MVVFIEEHRTKGKIMGYWTEMRAQTKRFCDGSEEIAAAVTKAERDALIRQYAAEGMPVWHLASGAGVTEARIKQIVKVG